MGLLLTNLAIVWGPHIVGRLLVIFTGKIDGE